MRGVGRRMVRMWDAADGMKQEIELLYGIRKFSVSC